MMGGDLATALAYWLALGLIVVTGVGGALCAICVYGGAIIETLRELGRE